MIKLIVIVINFDIKGKTNILIHINENVGKRTAKNDIRV